MAIRRAGQLGGRVRKGRVPLLELFHGLAHGHAVEVLTDLDPGGLKRFKGLGAHVTAEDRLDARARHALGGFDARALRHRLGRAVVEVGGFHRFGVDDHEPARASEARINHIIKRRAFAGNGDFLHVKLLLRRFRLGLGRQDRIGPALDAQRPSVDERVGHGAPGLAQRAAEGVARDAHPFGSLARGEPLQIGEAQGFEALHGQYGLSEFGHGYPARLEIRHAGLPFDVAAVSWPWHPFLRVLFK